MSSHMKDLIDQVTEQGYVVIPDVLSPAEVEQAKAEIGAISAGDQAGPAGVAGRTSFEGFQTQRIYALINKSSFFEKFVLLPQVLALNDHFLDDEYLLSACQSINIQPGEKAQSLHHDDGYANVPRPRRPFGAAIMIALDPFTEDNGGTVVVPKSHTWSDRFPKRSEAVSVPVPAGSILYFLSTLWHGGGTNSTNKSRLGLTVQYCQPWVRQIENMLLAVDWEKLDSMPPKLVGMLGYKVADPFIGHVDGRSPRARVTQLMSKWKRDQGSKL